MTIAGVYRRTGRRPQAGDAMRRRAAPIHNAFHALPSATRPKAGFVAIGGKLLDVVAVQTAKLVLIVDAIIGLGWLLGDPNRSAGPVYRPARDLTHWLPGAPSRWWGAILLLLTIGAYVAIRWVGELHARRAFAILTFYWTCWAVAYLWGFLNEPHAAFAPVGYALMAVVGNRRPAVAPQRVSNKAA